MLLDGLVDVLSSQLEHLRVCPGALVRTQQAAQHHTAGYERLSSNPYAISRRTLR